MSYTAIPWRAPMAGRDPDESHRSATPLELFFDLCFVVAVAASAATLHHDLSEDHLEGLLGYAAVFFAIWWAWVNYTWFASAYDSGDVVFRLGTFVIMVGVLVLAAGIPRAQGSENDFGIVVIGYAIMRLGLVPLWLRAARHDAANRRKAHRYALGITVVQIGWILRTVLLPDGSTGWALFILLVAAELAVPYLAEHGSSTPWHRHHVAERYELFTIIVLGEVILASTQAISSALDDNGLSAELSLVIIGGLLTVFGLWWFYFKRPMVECLSQETAFVFGYVHYFVFASIAAVGAALAAVVDLVEHKSHGLGETTALVLLAGAVAAYLIVLSGVHALADRSVRIMVPALVVAALLFGIAVAGLAVGVSVLLMGLLIVVVVVEHTARNQPEDAEVGG